MQFRNLQEIKKKKILFITTKNIDYIRNTQEINLFYENNNHVDLIASKSSQYIIRLIYIYFSLLFVKSASYDFIFIGFAPQLILPFWYMKFRKQYLIIDFFISLYDTLVFDRKTIKKSSIFAKLLRSIDIVTIRHADYVISDTKAHGNYFIEEFGLIPDKLEVLYLKADNSIYYPRLANKTKKLINKFVILYFGTILPLQGVSTILDAIERIKDHKDFYFQIIGPIGNKIKKPIAKNIEYIEWVNQDILAEYIANADLCLAGHFANDIDKAKRTIPGKAYIFNWMNKKMILGDNEANREQFSQSHANVRFVEMGNSEALENVMYELGQNWINEQKRLSEKQVN